MANGDHDFTAGEILTAANVDDYLMLQAVQKFATSAARDSALTSRKREGSVSIQDDSNSLTVYSGAAWSTVGPLHGALTTWTPTVTQLGSVANTATYATYSRIGRLVFFQGLLAITGSGTGANAVTISLPVTGQAAGRMFAGIGLIQDVSASQQYAGPLDNETSSSTFNISAATSGSLVVNSTLGITAFTAGLANGDFIKFSGFYEAAADA